MTDMITAARAWIDNGRAVIPIPYKTKRPVLTDWTNMRITAETAGEYFDGEPSNIGVLLGEPSGGLIDVDLDVAEAVAAASYFLPDTYLYGRERRPASHRLYVCAGAVTKKWQHGGTMLAELRSTGCQSLIPPSVHPDGDPYVRDPIVRQPAGEIAPDVLLKGLGRVAAAALIAQHWRGARHDMTLALAGALLHSGWTAPEVETFVEAVAAAGGDEELGDRIRAARDTAADHAAGKPTTGWPTLAESLPADVVERVREWLDIQDFPVLEPAPKPDDDGLVLVRASSIPPRKLEPLWPGVLWLGKPTLAVGDPDRGKSLLLLDVAARVTTGAPWPCSDERREPGDVLLASAEDDPDDTIVPRLIAAGADLERVHFIRGVKLSGKTSAFALDSHWTQFAEAVRRIKPCLIELDPLSAFLGRTDSNNEGETRVLLAGLAEIARESRAAVLALRHFRKGGSETPHGRVIGSIAFTAAARAVYAVLADPEDEARRLLIKVKCNLAQDTPGYSYRIVGTPSGDPKIEWDGEHDYRTAEELLGDGPAEKQRECDECGEMFVGRRDAKYCSRACRQHAHRERQKTVTHTEPSRSVTKCNAVTDRDGSLRLHMCNEQDSATQPSAMQLPMQPSQYQYACLNCGGKGCRHCDPQLQR